MQQKIKNFLKNSKCLWIVIWALLSIFLLQFDRRVVTLQLMSWTLIGFFGFVLCVFLVIKINGTRKKLFFVYVGILPLCLFIGEIYAYWQIHKPASADSADIVGSYPNYYWSDDAIVGYKAKPNAKGESSRINSKTNEVIYKVTYSTNKNGWRITPNSNEESKQCFLFFGDSFTYGEGVNNNETLEFHFGEATNRIYRIYNFAFHGYGPHQALALLQSGEVKRVLEGDGKCDEVIGLYESLPGHIARANLFSSWERENKNSPKFVLENGNLVWANENKNEAIPTGMKRIKRSIRLRLEKSYLWQLFFRTYKFNSAYNDLYFAILKKIQAELKTQFNANFVLFLWDSNNLSKDLEKQESSAITEWLKTSGITHFFMSQVASDYAQNRLKYGIHSADLHPNSFANQKIAEFLAEKIKKGEIKALPVQQTFSAKDDEK